MEPVVLQAVMLSDNTIIEGGTDKISLIGCFSVFVASNIPFRAPNFFVTPFITNLSGIQQSFNVTVRIVDANSGHVVASSAGTLAAKGEGQKIPRSLIFDRSFPFNGTIFPQAGRYRIEVLVNNDIIGQRDFEVNAVSAQAQSTVPGWFQDSLADVEAGHEVDLDTALNESPPEE